MSGVSITDPLLAIKAPIVTAPATQRRRVCLRIVLAPVRLAAKHLATSRRLRGIVRGRGRDRHNCRRRRLVGICRITPARRTYGSVARRPHPVPFPGPSRLEKAFLMIVVPLPEYIDLQRSPVDIILFPALKLVGTVPAELKATC